MFLEKKVSVINKERSANDIQGVRPANSTPRRESRSQGEVAGKDTYPAKETPNGSKARKPVHTSLLEITEKARKNRKYRFQNLYTLINEEMLHETWPMLNKRAAVGVDNISYDEYQKDLNGNIHRLVERLKNKQYKAKLVRRHYIPKGEGKMRPLGIPAIEDKLVQLSVMRILEAIYEQDFLSCMYGYRPSRGAKDAVMELRNTLNTKTYRYVVEADIKGYFDNLNHDWLVKMLEERIDDRAMIRLIQKWLSAGVLDTDGKVISPVTGSPQGGIISPMLANIYMHYVLVLWFEKIIQAQCRGKVKLFVYADDFICLFERKDDAERLYAMLGERLGKFGLELSPEKTKIIDFRMVSEEAVFDFLGFEFRWRKGRRYAIRIRTSKKKLKKAFQSFREWCKGQRSSRLKMIFKTVKAKLRGFCNYYGISGNSESLGKYFRYVILTLFRWLNRRSQRKSYTWIGFKDLVTHFGLEYPRTVHN